MLAHEKLRLNEMAMAASPFPPKAQADARLVAAAPRSNANQLRQVAP
jgi:hypothetical protein